MDAPRPSDDEGNEAPDIHPAHAFQLLMLHGTSRTAWEQWRKSGDQISPARADELAAERAAKLAPKKAVKRKGPQ